MANITINIDGMSCGHRIQWIGEALGKIDGVCEVKVRLESQNAVVAYDDTVVTRQMMASAIEKAGYSVKSFT